jgi:hypothetical protein
VQKSLYVFGTDYDTLEAESIVARWDFVGCWIPNKNEIRPTGW